MAWLTGFNYRAKITIDSSLIDGALTDFPVFIAVNATSGTGNRDLTALFDNLSTDSNRKKIAVTEDDGTTQQYVEIESYDFGSETMNLNTKVASILSGVDTDLYLYWDSEADDNTTYVGDVTESAAQSVWDSSYESVWHLIGQGDGTADEYKDSTSNENHGSASRGAGTYPTEGATGPKGTSQVLDSGDMMTFPISTIATGGTTIEAIFATTNSDAVGLYETGGAASQNRGFYVNKRNTQKFETSASKETVGTFNYRCLEASPNMNDGVFRHLSHTWDGTTDADQAKNYIDGTVSETRTALQAQSVPENNNTIMGGFHYQGTYYFRADCTICEERVSEGVRAPEWLKATKATLFDELQDYGTVEINVAPWLDGFNNRAKIIIDNSKVDVALTDFPVFIAVNATSGTSSRDLTAVFDNLSSDTNRLKIAVTENDGVTQQYVEIESYDFDNETMNLNSKVASILASIDTELYLYWDATADDNTTYVGDTTSTPAQNVWDDNFESVWHVIGTYDGTSEESKDSTSNENHGKGTGSIPAEATTGPKGTSQEFDGANTLRFPQSLIASGGQTIETIFATDEDSGAGMYENGGAGSQHGGFYVTKPAAGNFRTLGSKGSVGTYNYTLDDVGDMEDGVFRHVAHTWTGDTTSNGAKNYVNGAVGDTGTALANQSVAASPNQVLGGFWFAGTHYNNFEGTISETRVSIGVRAPEWLKATHSTLFNEFQEYAAVETNVEPGTGLTDTFFPDENPHTTGQDMFVNVRAGDNWHDVISCFEKDTSYDILNDFDQNTSWDILNDSQVDAAWDILNAYSVSIAWDILNEFSQNTSWDVINEFSQSTSWDILNEFSQSIAYDILNDFDQGTSWHNHPGEIGYIAEFILKYVRSNFEITPPYVEPRRTYELDTVQTNFTLKYAIEKNFTITAVIDKIRQIL